MRVRTIATVSRTRSEGPRVLDPVLGTDLDPVARPEPEDETPARELVHRRGGHRDGGRGADEYAADGGAEADAAGPERAGGEDRELVAAVPLRDPRGLVAERLRPLRAIGDLGGGEPAGKRDSDPRH